MYLILPLLLILNINESLISEVGGNLASLPLPVHFKLLGTLYRLCNKQKCIFHFGFDCFKYLWSGVLPWGSKRTWRAGLNGRVKMLGFRDFRVLGPPRSAHGPWLIPPSLPSSPQVFELLTTYHMLKQKGKRPPVPRNFGKHMHKINLKLIPRIPANAASLPCSPAILGCSKGLFWC